MTGRQRELCDWCGCVPATWEALRRTDGPLETSRRCACDRHLDSFVEFLRDRDRSERYDLTRLCRPDGAARRGQPAGWS